MISGQPVRLKIRLRRFVAKSISTPIPREHPTQEREYNTERCGVEIQLNNCHTKLSTMGNPKGESQRGCPPNSLEDMKIIQGTRESDWSFQ